MSSKVLEVCVDSFESAMAAILGGASRLELCSSLSEGGMTPTPGLLIQVQNQNVDKVPVYCMIRCRPGNFVYTHEEMEIMKEDAKILRKLGADGIVFGALLENGDVDMKNSREIVKAAFPLPLTFHRAFDYCRRPTIEMEVIIDLGFSRILTSGKQVNAQMGVKLIKKLIDQAEKRIIIMPGCGVTVETLKYIIDNTGAVEYHGSFKKPKPSTMTEGETETEAKLCDKEVELFVTSQDLVAEAVHILSLD